MGEEVKKPERKESDGEVIAKLAIEGAHEATADGKLRFPAKTATKAVGTMFEALARHLDGDEKSCPECEACRRVVPLQKDAHR